MYNKGHIYYGKTEEEILSLRVSLASGSEFISLYNEYQAKYGHGKTYQQVKDEHYAKCSPVDSDSKRIEKGSSTYGM